MALVFFFSHLAAKKWDYCQSLVMFWSIVYIQRGYFVRKWWLLLLNCYCTYVLYNLVHYRNNILWHLLVGNSYFYLCFRKSVRTLKNMLHSSSSPSRVSNWWLPSPLSMPSTNSGLTMSLFLLVFFSCFFSSLISSALAASFSASD